MTVSDADDLHFQKEGHSSLSEVGGGEDRRAIQVNRQPLSLPLYNRIESDILVP